MRENFLGIDGTIIPEEYVPFDFIKLHDIDRIRNSEGIELVYRTINKGYTLYTNDPRDYLSESQLLQNWRKV